MKPKPLAMFNAYPEPGKSSLFFIVHIWRTATDMRIWVRKSGMGAAGLGRSYWGLSRNRQRITVEKGKRDVFHRDIGEIHFVRNAMGVGVVSHECSHAALGYFKHKGIEIGGVGKGALVHPSEERFCYAVGALTSAIYQKVYKDGILKPGEPTRAD